MLHEIQAKLKAPKGQTNKFGGYRYRSCEDIVEAVKPILNQYKISLILSDEIVEVGGRVYVKATAQLVKPIPDDLKEVIRQKGFSGYLYIIAESTAYAREQDQKKGMDEAQITGAASSYARKYALNGLFAIDDTKDADTLSPEDNEKPVALQSKEFESEVREIKKALADNDLAEASRIWFQELSDDAKKAIWTAPTKGGHFEPEERAIIKSKEFRLAYYGESAA